MKIILTLLLAWCLFNYSNAQTSDFDKGLVALDAKNFDETINLLKPYAEKGNCTAQFAVGFAYMFGENVKNDSLARHWLALSAEQKQPKAMGPLSVSYFNGDANDDIIKAYVWAVLAAEYDPIQRMTTTKTLLEQYIKPDELKRANKLIEDYKRKWRDKENCK
jgi:hypothetical protein